MKVAIIISTYNRKELLKRSLESLSNSIDKIIPEIYIYDDGSTDGTGDWLMSLRIPMGVVVDKKNRGLRHTLTRLLDNAYFRNPDYICYCQDDIEYEKGWLDKCVEMWEAKELPNKIGFVTGHDAPEHRIIDGCKTGNYEFTWKDTCRATHLFASTERWEEFGEIPDLTPGIAAPKPGHGSLVDWWLVGHPEDRYPHSKNSLKSKGEKVLCIPNLVKHIGSGDSTWGVQTPERGRLIPNRIGIQIITKNRPDYLSVLLASLKNQTIKNWDLFILDNSDKPLTDSHLVMSILERLQFEGHRVIMGRSKEKDTGELRSAILDVDDCEYGCRIDDDSLVEPDYLELLFNTIKKDKKIGAVGGLVPALGREKTYVPTPPIINRVSKFWDVDEMSSLYFYNHHKPIEACDLRSSFLFRNDIVKKIRPAICYGPTGYKEETDLVLRIGMSGYKIFLHPDAVCWHVMAPTGGTRGNPVEDVKWNNTRKFKQRMEEFKNAHSN